jgi:2-keto-4-pentenoate hydratase/2-oxohepta-3-ene-1,7-dioic acid hydratase in catechol pathway
MIKSRAIRHRLLAVLLMFIPFMSAPLLTQAQTGPTATSAEPFKLGTFRINGVPTVGIVLRDQYIVDLAVANRDLETNPIYPRIPMPDNMIDLIGQYEYGLKFRLYELVTRLVNDNMVTGANQANYIYDRQEVHVMAPLQYPGKILNAAVNFYSHVNEAGTEEQRREAMRQRQENRGVPYLFLKPSRGAVIGADDEIIIPYGRDRTDWEVELGAVIGRPAKYVSALNAQDYVFGYTITMDISDRGGRPPGGYGVTSDWFVGKGHDTFAPMGPWIVPKEFYGDPMANLRQTLSVNGERIQEAQAGDMIHTLWELIEYGSSIITLFPGDVINNGTSGGTMGVRASGQSFLQDGEVVEASIDGVGTMTIRARAETSRPEGTGAQLTPVREYRP